MPNANIHTRHLWVDEDGAEFLRNRDPSECLSLLRSVERVIVVTHGYNVPWDGGRRSLAKFIESIIAEGALSLETRESLILNTCWSGYRNVVPIGPQGDAFDAMTYPLMMKRAIGSGETLGEFLLTQASSIKRLDIVSHSLGSVVALETLDVFADGAPDVLRGSNGSFCAAACDWDWPRARYANVVSNLGSFQVLLSENDRTLTIAREFGDRALAWWSKIAPSYGDANYRKALGAVGPFGRRTELSSPDHPTLHCVDLTDEGFDHDSYVPHWDSTPDTSANGLEKTKHRKRTAAIVAAGLRKTW